MLPGVVIVTKRMRVRSAHIPNISHQEVRDESITIVRVYSIPIVNSEEVRDESADVVFSYPIQVPNSQEVHDEGKTDSG